MALHEPGTGKTRRLMELAMQAIQKGCDARDIGYISFTKQAIQEARERILTQPGITEADLLGFKTMHAMIYWILGLDSSRILSEELALEELKHLADEDSIKHYLGLYAYSRIKGVKPSEVWDPGPNFSYGTELDYLEFIVNYKALKRQSHRIDFHDIIDQYVRCGRQFPFKYLFIDEAQDFTPAQWQAAKVLAQFADHVIVAGDPDQAIFEWAGADGNLLSQLEGRREVLEQSYRVPQLPYIFAKRVLKSMKRDILYHPTENEGAIKHLKADEIMNLPLDNGESWFFLARNQYTIERIKQCLYKHTVPFKDLTISIDSDSSSDKAIRWINWYQMLLDGVDIRESSKAKLQGIIPNLDKHIQDKAPWQRAFVAWPIGKIEYYTKILDQYESVRVYVGTWHSCKGTEAQNVVLLGDCTRTIAYKHSVKDISELKLLYVAITRTRNNLYIVEPYKGDGIPWWRLFRLPEDLHNGVIS